MSRLADLATKNPRKGCIFLTFLHLCELSSHWCDSMNSTSDKTCFKVIGASPLWTFFSLVLTNCTQPMKRRVIIWQDHDLCKLSFHWSDSFHSSNEKNYGYKVMTLVSILLISDFHELVKLSLWFYEWILWLPLLKSVSLVLWFKHILFHLHEKGLVLWKGVKSDTSLLIQL